MPPKKNAGKKAKNDDWDDDAAERKLAALKLSEEKEKAEGAWDDESDEEPPVPAPKKGKAAFAALMMQESEDEEKKSESEPEHEPEPVSKPIQNAHEKKPQKKEEPKQDKKKKKGKKGKQEADDEDIDALLASIEDPNVKKVSDVKAAAVPIPEDSQATAISQPTEQGQDDAEGGDGADEGGKKKKKKKKGKKEGTVEPEGEGDDAAPKADEDGEDKDIEDGEGEGGEGKKKKKKKKDKKKDEGEGKPKKKKGVDFIKEMLRAKQEAEEAEEKRIKAEEERLEAIAKAKEEEERLAREKKEAQKLAKKQKIEKAKAEGTYMTAAQREKQKIAQAKLIAAGISVADNANSTPVGEKKPIVYMDKKALRRQQAYQAKKAAEAAAAAAQAAVASELVNQEIANQTDQKNEEVADDWAGPNDNSSAPIQDEPLDDWEAADHHEIPEAVTPAVPTKATPAPAPTGSVVKESIDAEESESSSEEEESSEEESSEEEESSDEAETYKGKETKEQIAERVKARLQKRREQRMAARTVENLRAPVICVMGHVDTGKTKMLDTIRRTNVQDGEAGGITQQIGATQVPGDAIKMRCRNVRDFKPDEMKIPGFLVIDTPGHESFSNLRNRGSSLCDFAILVVDIMHGLEPQTKESLKMLLDRKTPFVVALNKIDRLYGYAKNPEKDVYQHLKSQPQNTQLEFKERYDKIVAEFSELGLNIALSNQNKNPEEYYSMVPTSAFFGDGIGNLMAFIVKTTQTQYAEKLAFCEELEASVMEVKVISGLGTTIDVILVNGRLKENDIIILTGTDGPIVTPIRGLLMPQPLRELRVKNEYTHYKEVMAAQGVKVLAKNLEKAVAGLPIFVASRDDEVDVLCAEAESQLSRALTAIKKKPEGVYVQASTLGSLEALLTFLKDQKIPYSNVNIGPVHKKDVQKAATMKEHNPEFACILAFDVKIEREAQIFADREGVRIFAADIIYHLQDSFLKYREDLREKARKDNESRAVFPCKLRVLPQHVFNARNPIVCGVVVEAGHLKKGTPICVPSKDCIVLGTVSSIQRNHEEVSSAKKGDEVCIKIENTTGEAPKLYGRHFTHEDLLVSKITRDSIDVCKTYFRDDLSREDWQLVVQLKKVLDIM